MRDATVNVDVRALLSFFDEKEKSTRRHASAIVAVAGEDLGAALLVQYFKSLGMDAETLPDNCTQGTPKGCRLDRWVFVRNGNRETLYQMEIKNWSAHAIGGRKLALSADAEETRKYKIERWAKEWDGNTFRKPSVLKVLTPMRNPRPGIEVEPLVCFWTALHPVGAGEPFFSLILRDNPRFKRVSIFSMSAYLRSLKSSRIKLSLPSVTARREWLGRLFPGSPA